MGLILPKYLTPGWSPLRVPSGRFEIDPSHPLSRGIVACYVPGTGNFSDLAGFGPRLNFDTGAALGVNAYGPALLSNAPNGRLYSSIFPNAWKLTTAGTISWIGRYTSGGINNSAFWGNTANPTGAAPYVGYQIGYSGNNTANFFYNGSNNFHSLSNSSIPSVLSSISASFVVGGQIVLYMNGQTQQSATWVDGAPDYTGGPISNVGGDSNDTSRYINASTNAVMTWNRALSASEIALLNAAPFSMLRPATARRFYLPSTLALLNAAAASRAVSSGSSLAMAFAASSARSASASSIRPLTVAGATFSGKSKSISRGLAPALAVAYAAARSSASSSGRVLTATGNFIVFFSRSTAASVGRAAAGATATTQATSRAASRASVRLAVSVVVSARAIAASAGHALASASAVASVAVRASSAGRALGLVGNFLVSAAKVFSASRGHANASVLTLAAAAVPGSRRYLATPIETRAAFTPEE